jgi:hypothetical protein
MTGAIGRQPPCRHSRGSSTIAPTAAGMSADNVTSIRAGRWEVCRVCGEGFAPRTLKQDVCDLSCFYRDPRRYIGHGMKMLQAERKRERMRRAA